MGLNHSPKIVTDGLVFAYDMANTKKSWKGAPTTNIISGEFDTTFESLADASTAGFNNQLGTGNYLGVVSTIGYNSTKSLKINNGTGGTGRVYRTFSVLLGEYAAVSAWVYCVTAGSYLTIEYSGGNYNWGVAQTRNTHTGTGWELLWVRTDGAATSNTTGYYFLYPGGDNKDTYWDNIQVEKQQYQTPYINGTRSNTQALIDLTGNNTITASSLTYASDGTFSFNGSSDYITIPNTTLGNGNVPWTVSAWVKTNTTVNALGQGSVLSNSSGGPVYSMMGVNAGKIVYWTYQNAAWVQKLGTGKTVNDNTWHLLTWVNYNNYTMDMYVDGVLDSNVPNSTSGNNNPVDRIGGSWAAQFNGSISSLSRYNRALSAAEVKQNFNALRGRYGI